MFSSTVGKFPFFMAPDDIKPVSKYFIWYYQKGENVFTIFLNISSGCWGLFFLFIFEELYYSWLEREVSETPFMGTDNDEERGGLFVHGWVFFFKSKSLCSSVLRMINLIWDQII